MNLQVLFRDDTLHAMVVGDKDSKYKASVVWDEEHEGEVMVPPECEYGGELGDEVAIRVQIVTQMYSRDVDETTLVVGQFVESLLK